MFHSIITILTTAAVALHATVGCCAHHPHVCDSHESGLAVVTSAESDDHCSHSHHHDEGSNSPIQVIDADCGCEHDGGGHHECDEGDCSFASVHRGNDLELMLSFSTWCQALGDTANADAIDGLLSRHSAADTIPDPLMDTGSTHAISQVWRL